MASTKRLLMLTTGGTIAGNVASVETSQHQSNLDQVLGRAREQIQQNWDIEVNLDSAPIDDVDSSDILPSHWSDIIDSIKQKYDDYDGFIVTHGTNTMGYTCAALSFAFQNLNKPVVVTGSQVPFGWPGSDALMNLENALRVVTWPYHSIRGIVCLFGSHIITGTRAKKSTEFDLDAFQTFSSAGIGRVGRIISINEDNLRKHNKYADGSNSINSNFTAAIRARDLIVDSQFDMSLLSLTEFPGMSPETFQLMLAPLVEGDSPKVKGIIFRAFGAGDVSTHLHGVLRYLKDLEVPVVVTTQAPNGNSTFTVNKPGQLLAAEKLAIPAHNMSIEAMTAKFSWLLGRNTDLLLFSWAVWQCRAQAAAGEHRHGDERFGCVESVGAFGQCS